jgi:hypothetical protein
MTNFSADLDKAYKKKVLGSLEAGMRKAAITIQTELTTTTPVDTGRAKGNWLPSVNTPNKSKGGVVSDVSHSIRDRVANIKFSDTIYINNNLPYIIPLNGGSSEQRAAGFVERAIQIGKASIR